MTGLYSRVNEAERIIVSDKEYAAAQNSIAQKRLALITDYAQNLDKMDDAKARDLTDHLFATKTSRETRDVVFIRERRITRAYVSSQAYHCGAPVSSPKCVHV